MNKRAPSALKPPVRQRRATPPPGRQSLVMAAVILGCLRMNPPAWLVWIPPFAPFLLLLKPALLPAAAWGPVLVEIFGASAGLIWAGGRLLSGQGFARFHQSRPQDAQRPA